MTSELITITGFDNSKVGKNTIILTYKNKIVSKENKNRYNKSGYIFNSSMTEGMIRVGLLSRHFKSNQCNDGRAGIG